MGKPKENVNNNHLSCFFHDLEFLKLVDTLVEIKSAETLCNVLEVVIIGLSVENVAQVITNNLACI